MHLALTTPHLRCLLLAICALKATLRQGRTVEVVLDAVHRGEDGPRHGLQRLKPVCSSIRGVRSQATHDQAITPRRTHAVRRLYPWFQHIVIIQCCVFSSETLNTKRLRLRGR